MAAEQDKNGEGELDKGSEDEAAMEEIVTTDSDCNAGRPTRPIPPFLLKLYDMLGNSETNSLVSWSCTGTSFVITNPHFFAANVLPIYFRHRNFQNFITQLNSYGFRKISWEQWEYRNGDFRKGERNLLRNIKRRNQISHRSNPSSGIQPCASSGSNMENEFDILTKEHDLVKAEIMKLKEKQETLEDKVASLKNPKRIIRDPGNSDDTQNTLKGKKSATTYECDKRRSDICSCRKNMVLDEQEMAFISLEDMIGGSSDWFDYFKDHLFHS